MDGSRQYTGQVGCEYGGPEDKEDQTEDKTDEAKQHADKSHGSVRQTYPGKLWRREKGKDTLVSDVSYD